MGYFDISGEPAAWAAVIGFAGYAQATRRSAYRDPRITLAVRKGEVEVRGVGQAHEISYDRAALTITIYWQKSSCHFVGIRLETPAGPIGIEDGNYREGRNAAAAICARLDALGRLPEIPPRPRLIGL